MEKIEEGTVCLPNKDDEKIIEAEICLSEKNYKIDPKTKYINVCLQGCWAIFLGIIILASTIFAFILIMMLGYFVLWVIIFLFKQLPPFPNP
jgi:hypothetical protein